MAFFIDIELSFQPTSRYVTTGLKVSGGMWLRQMTATGLKGTAAVTVGSGGNRDTTDLTG
jgi:hypothetical protein